MDAVRASRRIVGDGSSAAAWRADPVLAAVPAIALDALLGPGQRAVLVAPHPDDEVLACGGLLQQLAARSTDNVAQALLLVAVTDGEASHPASTLWPPRRLRQVRPRESAAALHSLGVGAAGVVRLGIADGAIGACQPALEDALRALLRPGDVLITTWRHDGHPDHEACARACAAVAGPLHLPVLEVPVWGWHWNTPQRNAMPLARARKLMLTAAQLQKKRAALALFASQLTADSSSGAAPVLAASAFERLLTPFELYFS